MPEPVRSALRVLPVRAAESFLRLFRLRFAPPGRPLRLVPSDALFRPVPSVPPLLPARSGLVSRSASPDSPFLLAPRDSPLRPVSFVLLPAELRTVPFVLPPVELRPVLRPVEPRFVLLPAELRPAPLLPHPAGAYPASLALPRKLSAPEL